MNYFYLFFWLINQKHEVEDYNIFFKDDTLLDGTFVLGWSSITYLIYAKQRIKSVWESYCIELKCEIWMKKWQDWTSPRCLYVPCIQWRASDFLRFAWWNSIGKMVWWSRDHKLPVTVPNEQIWNVFIWENIGKIGANVDQIWRKHCRHSKRAVSWFSGSIQHFQISKEENQQLIMLFPYFKAKNIQRRKISIWKWLDLQYEL